MLMSRKSRQPCSRVGDRGGRSGGTSLNDSSIIIGIGARRETRRCADEIREWAERIGATVAGSRAAVEAGWWTLPCKWADRAYDSSGFVYRHRYQWTDTAYGGHHRSALRDSRQPGPYGSYLQCGGLWLGNTCGRGTSAIHEHFEPVRMRKWMACVWLGMGSCFMTAQADEPLTIKFRSRALLDALCPVMARKMCRGIIAWKISVWGLKPLTGNMK